MIWHRIDKTPPPMDGTLVLGATSGANEFSGMFAMYWGGSEWLYSIGRPVYDPTHWAHITPPEDGEKQKAPTVK